MLLAKMHSPFVHSLRCAKMICVVAIRSCAFFGLCDFGCTHFFILEEYHVLSKLWKQGARWGGFLLCVWNACFKGGEWRSKKLCKRFWYCFINNDNWYVCINSWRSRGSGGVCSNGIGVGADIAIRIIPNKENVCACICQYHLRFHVYHCSKCLNLTLEISQFHFANILI